MVTAERIGPSAALAIGLLSALIVWLPAWAAATALVALCGVPVTWWMVSRAGRWLPLFFFAVLLMPPLPIPLGDSGPHPAMFLAAVGLIVGIIRIDQWNIRMQAIDVALLALLFALTLSLGFAAAYAGLSIAAMSAARVVLFGISVYVYFAAAHGPDRQHAECIIRTTRMLFFIAVVAGLFGCIDFLYQLPTPAGFAPQFLWLDSGVYRRAQGLFYESSTLGNFCAFFVVFIAVCLAEPRSRRLYGTTILSMSAIVFVSAMLLSFSRASGLACMISLSTLAVLERRRIRLKRGVVWVMGLACASMILFTIVVPEVATGYWDRLGLAISGFQDSPDRSLSGRLASWSTVLTYTHDHPWQIFFGIGYKTLPYADHLGSPVIADNMYLSLLVETGVLGLLALLALNSVILTTAWRAQRAGSLHGKWMFCFWIGESVQMLSGDILTYWRVLPLYFWVLAQAVQANREAGDARPAD